MPLTADCYDCRRRRAAVAGQQLVAIVDPRAAKLVTGRHWIEDDGAARLEATEKGIVERRGDCYEFRGAGNPDSSAKSSLFASTTHQNGWAKEGRTLTCSDLDQTEAEY